MALPRVLIAVPLIAAGAFLPRVGFVAVRASTGAIGMGHEHFTTDKVKIHRGKALTFVNDSQYMHILGPGKDGTLIADSANAMFNRQLMQANASYTTPPFNKTGTFEITCSMHPTMNIKVIVTG
jgi:plastocyanin